MNILKNLGAQARALHVHVTQLDKTLRLFTGELKAQMIVQRDQLQKQLKALRARVVVLEKAQKLLETKPVLHVRFHRFLVSTGQNAILYAPTQVGKTQAIKDFIRICLENDVSVVLSCDNKTDQLDQMVERISIDMDHYDAEFIKVSDTKFTPRLRDAFQANRNVVFFCLDNAAQIERLKEQIALAITLEDARLPRLVLIHDEGDVITKDAIVDKVLDNQSESHKEWIRIVDFLQRQNVNLKRVFVTATPDNVLFKYPMSDIIQLPIPPDYTGHDKIKYVETLRSEEIPSILVEEVRRRRLSNESGIILYCVERQIEKGQDPTFLSVCSYLDCAVSVYNGSGITYRIPPPFYDAFDALLKKHLVENPKVKLENKTVKNLAISDFYEMCKRSGCTIVVTIGKDLMARGISFVSRTHAPDALAATTMIYRPGSSMHAVGMTQAIGRITGTARPDLIRTLYAPKDVMETYRRYHVNQAVYIAKMTSNLSTKMEEIALPKPLTRPLDRIKLRLKPWYKEVAINETVLAEEADDDEVVKIDGVDIKKLEQWVKSNNLLVGRMIRFIHDKKQTSLKELKKGLGYKGKDESLVANLNSGVGLKCHYGKLWIQEKNFSKITLNPKISTLVKKFIV